MAYQNGTSLKKINNTCQSSILQKHKNSNKIDLKNQLNELDIHKGTNINLHESMKNRLQNHFNHDISNVEFKQSDIPNKIGASAFAKGNVIQFNSGEFNQDTTEGKKLIAHEVAHVVQQSKENIKPDFGIVSTSEKHENAADFEAGKFLSTNQNDSILPLQPLNFSNASSTPLQGFFKNKLSQEDSDNEKLSLMNKKREKRKKKNLKTLNSLENKNNEKLENIKSIEDKKRKKELFDENKESQTELVAEYKLKKLLEERKIRQTPISEDILNIQEKKELGVYDLTEDEKQKLEEENNRVENLEKAANLSKEDKKILEKEDNRLNKIEKKKTDYYKKSNDLFMENFNYQKAEKFLKREFLKEKFAENPDSLTIEELEFINGPEINLSEDQLKALKYLREEKIYAENKETNTFVSNNKPAFQKKELSEKSAKKNIKRILKKIDKKKKNESQISLITKSEERRKRKDNAKFKKNKAIEKKRFNVEKHKLKLKILKHNEFSENKSLTDEDDLLTDTKQFEITKFINHAFNVIGNLVERFTPQFIKDVIKWGKEKFDFVLKTVKTFASKKWESLKELLDIKFSFDELYLKNKINKFKFQDDDAKVAKRNAEKINPDKMKFLTNKDSDFNQYSNEEEISEERHKFLDKYHVKGQKSINKTQDMILKIATYGDKAAEFGGYGANFGSHYIKGGEFHDLTNIITKPFGDVSSIANNAVRINADSKRQNNLERIGKSENINQENTQNVNNNIFNTLVRGVKTDKKVSYLNIGKNVLSLGKKASKIALPGASPFITAGGLVANGIIDFEKNSIIEKFDTKTFDDAIGMNDIVERQKTKRQLIKMQNLNWSPKDEETATRLSKYVQEKKLQEQKKIEQDNLNNVNKNRNKYKNIGEITFDENSSRIPSKMDAESYAEYQEEKNNLAFGEGKFNSNNDTLQRKFFKRDKGDIRNSMLNHLEFENVSNASETIQRNYYKEMAYKVARGDKDAVSMATRAMIGSNIPMEPEPIFKYLLEIHERKKI